MGSDGGHPAGSCVDDCEVPAGEGEGLWFGQMGQVGVDGREEVDGSERFDVRTQVVISYGAVRSATSPIAGRIVGDLRCAARAEDTVDTVPIETLPCGSRCTCTSRC